MGFIDVNNITNYGGPVIDNFDWWKLSGLLGVCIGFGFTYLNNKYTKKEERNEAGETFENQIRSFKNPIVKQIQDLKNYEYRVNQNEYGIVSDYLKHKFELIKSLNWQILIKYFKNKKHKDPIGYISNIYNSIDVLKFQSEKVNDVYSSFQKEVRDLMKEYKATIDVTRRKVIFYADTLNIGEQMNDELLIFYNDLDDKHIAGKGLTLKTLILLKDSYHLQLQQNIPKIHRHPLYSPIREGNLKAKDIIYKILDLIDEHTAFIEDILESYIENYKVIYNENLIIKADINANNVDKEVIT